MSARENILFRVRRALKKGANDETRGPLVEAAIAAQTRGPRPAMPSGLLEHFMVRATDMGSSVDRVASQAEIPLAVARYLTSLNLPQRLADQLSAEGVCWPGFEHLLWHSVGLKMTNRPAESHDKLSLTGAFCAIAETGTLVLRTGPDAPTVGALLPPTHVAVVPSARIVWGMEEAFALVRRECAAFPRAINLISGPSRTGDVEQTIVLGAHGPYRVHILIVD